MRLRRFGLRWSQTRTARRLERENRRLVLMLQLVDSQLLLLKQLEERQELLRSMQRELLESRLYREAGSPELPPGTATMDELLGL